MKSWHRGWSMGAWLSYKAQSDLFCYMALSWGSARVAAAIAAMQDRED